MHCLKSFSNYRSKQSWIQGTQCKLTHNILMEKNHYLFVFTLNKGKLSYLQKLAKWLQLNTKLGIQLKNLNLRDFVTEE